MLTHSLSPFLSESPFLQEAFPEPTDYAQLPTVLELRTSSVEVLCLSLQF